MNVLVVHNDYGRYSGEEAAVDRQIDELRRQGHRVETLRLSSQGSRDTIAGRLRGFFAGLFSIRGRRIMRRLLRSFHPDEVHIHNLYPFISPSVLPLIHQPKFSILNSPKVVMTVHNYRLICPTGLFLRNYRPCEQCLERGNEWACIVHNCEGNIFRSLGYALRNTVARTMGYYRKYVDQFICLTEFQRSKLIAAGFPADKIIVHPPKLPQFSIQNSKFEIQNSYVGYVGRLSCEKGWDMLLDVARAHPDIPFRFAGQMREGEAEKIKIHNSKIIIPDNVTFVGHLSANEMNTFYDQSRFIVLPSRCYEGFPLVIPEAFSHARCCIAPAHGAFPETMTLGNLSGGLFFEPLNTKDLEEKVVSLWNKPDLCRQLSHDAFLIFQSKQD